MAERAGQGGKRARLATRASLAGAVAVVSAFTVSWFFRAPLGEFAIARWCADRDLVCQAEVDAFGLDGARLRNVVVGGGEAPALRIETVEARLAWRGVLRPRISSLRLARPTLRLVADGRRIDLGGLDALLAENGGVSAPRLDAEEVRIVLATPAGDLEAAGELRSDFPRTLQASFDVAPAVLERGGARIVWTRGALNISLDEAGYSGSAVVDVDTLSLDGLQVDAARLEARIEDEAEAPVVRWTASSGRIETPHMAAGAARTVGAARFSLREDAPLRAVGERLSGAALTLEVADLELAGWRGADVTLSADLAGEAGALSGPVALEASDASMAEASARAAAATGEVAWTMATGAARFEGAVTVDGATLSDGPLRRTVVDWPSPPGAFEAHADTLKAALDAALRAFDAGLSVTASIGPDGWRFAARRSTRFAARSGLALSIEPFASGRWLEAESGGLAASGALMIDGGGAPSVSLVLDRAERVGADWSAAARAVELAPWTVGSRTVRADAAALEAANGVEGLRLKVEGEIGLEGEYFGLTLDDTRLLGRVDAARAAEGWRVETEEGACLTALTDGVAAQTLRLRPTAVSLCPTDGRFVRYEDGAPTGLVDLGAFALPYETETAEGLFALDGGRAEWSVSDGLAIRVSARTMRLKTLYPSADLEIEARTPELTLSADGGPLAITARLARARFSGGLMPARVEAGALRFQGRSSPTGLRGEAAAENVRVSDPSADPVYEPLLGDFTAEIADGAASLNGPVRLARSGVLVAAAQGRIDFPKATGEMVFSSAPIEFLPGGLQPHDFSERLRGVFQSSVGGFVGAARLRVAEGELSGGARLALRDFGFNGGRLGPVRGVFGEIEIEDLVELKTPPGQVVTIAEMHPGAPLREGALQFQILSPSEALIEEAVWPFAGGRLRVASAPWRMSQNASQALIVEAERLSLGDLVALFDIPDLEAEGRLGGRIPLEVSNGEIRLSGARLTAEGGGAIRYGGDRLDDAPAAAEALRDFRFSAFGVEADGTADGDLALRARLEEARSRRPVVFDVEVDADAVIAFLSGGEDASAQSN